MERWLKHVRRREVQFLAVILINLFCIAAYVADGFGVRPEGTGGWRRIDIEAVESLIDAGDLVRKEADWYRPFSVEPSPEP